MFMYVINAAAVAYEPSKPLVLEDVEVAPPQVTLIFLSFHLTGRYMPVLGLEDQRFI
jgi:hypothetical protein